MQPSELEIRREVEALRDLKRRSTAQGGPGAIPLDPDLPEIPPSPSSPLNGSPWGSSAGTDEQHDSSVADDPAHLFWVPARLHPELAPKEFRAFLKEHAREGAAGLQRANSASAAMSSSSSTLGRRRSMLSKQYQPSESDGVENERVIVRRNKSSIRAPAPQLTISDLQKLDELAEQISESDDPSKIRNMLRRSLSLNISPSLATDQTDDSIDVDDADSPIIPRGPNQILRRAARTKIRKPNLQGDGGGHRFPSTRRTRAQTIATSDGSEQDHEEPFHRPQAPSPEEVDRERLLSHTDESFIVDSYTDRRESLTSSESYSRSEEDSHVERRFTSSPPPLPLSVQPPSPEAPETQSQTATSALLSHQPSQKQLTAPTQTQGATEVIPSRSPSPTYSDSGSTTEMVTPVLLPSGPDTSSPAPGSSKATKTRGSTVTPPRKEEKKGLFKWGSKDSKRKSKGEPKEKPEKEKDSGFFGSLFGRKKHDDSNSPTGLLHNGSGPATAAALLGASKANRTNARSPSPQPMGSYARYPIHVERAIYRLSHIKLANARRPLLEQVLISNLMFWYLGIINKTTQPNITNPSNVAGGNVQGQNSVGEHQDREVQEREHEHEQRENAERERLEREKAEQLKESSRKGSLTRVPKPGADSARRAEMPIRGPQYESQHRAMEQEYGYLSSNSNGGAYGYGNPVQGPAPRSGPPSLVPNNPSYLQFNNIYSPQPIYPARSGSPTNPHTSPQPLQQPMPMNPGVHYFNYTDRNGQSQSQGMSYGLPPGAMLPTTMDQTWLGVGIGVSGKSSPSPPPSSPSQYSYHSPSPSPPPQNQQQSQTPPRRPRSPPPNHLTNSHPRHPTTTPPSARLPGRSLSATGISSHQQPGKLRKPNTNMGSTDSGVRRRSSDGESYAEEDVPLAVWRQQQRAGGRR